MSRSLPPYLCRHVAYLVRQSVAISDQLGDTLAYVSAHLPPECVSPRMVRRVLLYAERAHRDQTQRRRGAMARQRRIGRHQQIDAIVAECIATGRDVSEAVARVTLALAVPPRGNDATAARDYTLASYEAAARLFGHHA